MFKRLCRAETTEIYKSADDMLEGWFGFSRTASKNIVKAFEFNPKDFLYYRSRAITADVPNSNGDCFKKEELAKAYQSFIGKGVFYEHASDNPDNSFGIILDSNFVQPAGKNAYIEILCAVDRKLAEEKYPGLVHRVESGMLSGTSMGCLAGAAECGICGNYTTTLEGLCEHMNPDSMGYVKGKLINASTNEYGFEYNYNITFIEDSIVNVPADSTAQIFEVFAANKDKLDPSNPNKEVINTLIAALNAMAKKIN
jgi:hypothetical protein